jgi:hypothetical protein
MALTLPLVRENILWAAGLLEGEGSFRARVVKSKTGTQHWAISIQCALHCRDKDVLEKLQSILGGNISGPYPDYQNHKGQEHMMYWGVYNKNDCYATVAAVFQFLGKRRQEQCLKLIEAFKQQVGKGRKQCLSPCLN